MNKEGAKQGCTDAKVIYFLISNLLNIEKVTKSNVKLKKAKNIMQ
jgi:hypothetical protein